MSAAGGVSLLGRTVLVTGGSSGIGNAIARGLFEAGAQVFVLARRAPHTWERPLPAAWPAERGFLQADLGDAEGTRRCLERWLAAEGRALDALVHSAVTYGSPARRPFTQMRLEEWDRVFAVGPRAYFNLVHSVLPVLLARPAALILSLSSEVAYNPAPGRIDYGASKAASRSLSMSLAEELRDTRVSVVELLPEGMVDTPGIRRRRPPGTDLSGHASADSFAPAACRLVASAGAGLNGCTFMVAADGALSGVQGERPPSQTHLAEARPAAAGVGSAS